MTQTSFWLDTLGSTPSYPELKMDLSVDVAVVGAGIHGVLATYLLSKAGLKVCLVEQETIGSGDTGYTTAFISHQIDTDLEELISTFGHKHTQQVWEACQTAITELERIVNSEKIDCDFQRVTLSVAARDDQGWKDLQKEHQLAQELDFNLSLEADSSVPLAKHGALLVPNQAKFHPLKFLTALAKIAHKKGAIIFEHTRVEKIDLESPSQLYTPMGTITAKSVIAATGSPINSQLMIQSKITPYNSFVISGELKKQIPEGLYIDTETPYHYLRVDRQGNKSTFLFGGEDKQTGDQTPAEESFKKLADFLHEEIDSKAIVTHQWGGQILHSLDGLPYIGRHPFHRHQFVGVGFGGDGMPFGTLAALINAGLILNQDHRYAHLFSPSRIKNLGQYLQHSLKYPEEMIKKHLQHQKGNLEELAANEGMVIDLKGEKVAVSKNEKGDITKVSAVCTHMGCIVNWNSALKTWDCPCHGSRFGSSGEVIHGPATKPLAPIT